MEEYNFWTQRRKVKEVLTYRVKLVKQFFKRNKYEILDRLEAGFFTFVIVGLASLLIFTTVMFLKSLAEDNYDYNVSGSVEHLIDHGFILEEGEPFTLVSPDGHVIITVEGGKG